MHKPVCGNNYWDHKNNLSNGGKGMDYGKLDDLAAPDQYVAPSSRADVEYIIPFRQACKR